VGRSLDLEAMAEAAFVVQPLTLKGGTGSTVAPIAIK
jgi:hypothetical protein